MDTIVTLVMIGKANASAISDVEDEVGAGSLGLDVVAAEHP